MAKNDEPREGLPDGLEKFEAFLAENPGLPGLLRRLRERHPEQPGRRLAVGRVVGEYLKFARRRVKEATYQVRACVLGLFARAFRGRLVCNCLPHHLEEWVQAQQGWRSDWTRKRAITDVQACFNWAARTRLIPESPFRGVTWRQGEPWAPVTPGQLRAMLRASDRRFRWVLLFLARTGCRPGELCALRWEHIDWDRGAAVLPPGLHKTGRKTGRQRVIALPAAALRLLARLRAGQRAATARTALVRILAGGPVPAEELLRRMLALGYKARHYWWARRAVARLRTAKEGHKVVELAGRPDAPRQDSEHVFLNRGCLPWVKHALDARLQRLRKRAGLPPTVKLYGCRHAFATGVAKAGVDLKTLAELMGHTTTRMTEHYVHVAGNVDHLRAAAERALGRAAAPGKGVG
jgi:integrase